MSRVPRDGFCEDLDICFFVACSMAAAYPYEVLDSTLNDAIAEVALFGHINPPRFCPLLGPRPFACIRFEVFLMYVRITWRSLLLLLSLLHLACYLDSSTVSLCYDPSIVDLYHSETSCLSHNSSLLSNIVIIPSWMTNSYVFPDHLAVASTAIRRWTKNE